MVEGKPRIVALIPDGNRRWAERHNLPRVAGHKKGMDQIEVFVDESYRQGVEEVVVYVASGPNITNRGEEQLNELSGLLADGLKHGPKERMLHNGVALDVIGDPDSAFNQEIADGLRAMQEESKGNDAIKVYLAINYDGQREIADAAEQAKIKHPNERITPELLGQYLYTPFPNVDLLIRTGAQGRNRLSKFLTWQVSSNTELHFTNTLWPDFGRSQYRRAISKYEQTVLNNGR